MAKLPSLQFYPGDWRKDPGVQALDYFSRGVWLEILLLMFESDERGKLMLNGAKMPDSGLAKLLGLSESQTKRTVDKLLEYGVASRETDTGILFCRRMVRDEGLRQVRAECGKLGAEYGQLGGRPKGKPNPKITPNAPNNGGQKKPPSSSSSPSGNSGEVKNTSPDGHTVEATIWTLGVELLVKGAAMSEERARGFLGKQIKLSSEEIVAGAIGTATAKKPANLPDYIAGIVKKEQHRREAITGVPVDDVIRAVVDKANKRGN